MTYKLLTPSSIKSAFLGVLLLGRKLVPQWAHVLSAILIALGMLVTSLRIMVVNSRMLTPDGYRIIDGKFLPDSMPAIVYTPSFLHRLSHTATPFLTTTAFDYWASERNQ